MKFFSEQSSWNGSIKGKREKENFDKKILKSKKFDKIKNLCNFFGTKFLEWINKKRKKRKFYKKILKSKKYSKKFVTNICDKIMKKSF